MDDQLLQLLTKISSDVGEVKGSVNGLHDVVAAHVLQDTSVQTKLFERLGALEVAHATTVGKGLAYKSVLAGLGAAGGFAGHMLKLKFWP